MIIPKHFYLRRPDVVARELLGKKLIRSDKLSCYIVETEAYFGPEDPASRARRGGELADVMRGDVGVTLIYGVHGQWLLNIVAHAEGEAGAVLIRSVLADHLVRGPGRVTKLLRIDKSLHKHPVFLMNSELRVENGIEVPEECVIRRGRVGVKLDLGEPLNFTVSDDCIPDRY